MPVPGEGVLDPLLRAPFATLPEDQASGPILLRDAVGAAQGVPGDASGRDEDCEPTGLFFFVRSACVRLRSSSHFRALQPLQQAR